MSFLVLGFATGITSGFSVVIAQRAEGRGQRADSNFSGGLLLAVYSSDCSDDDFRVWRGRFPSSDHRILQMIFSGMHQDISGLYLEDWGLPSIII